MEEECGGGGSFEVLLENATQTGIKLCERVGFVNKGRNNVF